MIETLLSTPVLDIFSVTLSQTFMSLSWNADDIGRIRHLATRYAELPLGFSNAAVIACTECNGGRVLSLGHRGFDVVGRDMRMEFLP